MTRSGRSLLAARCWICLSKSLKTALYSTLTLRVAERLLLFPGLRVNFYAGDLGYTTVDPRLRFHRLGRASFRCRKTRRIERALRFAREQGFNILDVKRPPQAGGVERQLLDFLLRKPAIGGEGR